MWTLRILFRRVVIFGVIGVLLLFGYYFGFSSNKLPLKPSPTPTLSPALRPKRAKSLELPAAKFKELVPPTDYPFLAFHDDYSIPPKCQRLQDLRLVDLASYNCDKIHSCESDSPNPVKGFCISSLFEFDKKYYPHYPALPHGTFLEVHELLFFLKREPYAAGRSYGLTNTCDLALKLSVSQVHNYPEGIFLRNPWDNYYHSLMDFLPMLLIARDFILNNPHIPIFVGDTKGMLPLLLHLAELDHLNLTFILSNMQTPIFLSKAYIPLIAQCMVDERVPHPGWFDRLKPYIINAIDRKLIPGIAEKFFKGTVKRKNDWPNLVLIWRPEGPRVLPNFKELEETLRETYPGDFQIFCGNLTFEDSVELFVNADLTVGVHGGGLTNLLFMRDGTTVLELMPDHWEAKFYMNMSKSSKLIYRRISGHGYWNLPLIIEIPKVVENIYDIVKINFGKELPKEVLEKPFEEEKTAN